MGGWHTYPMGSGYQLMKPTRGGDDTFGEEECGSRGREREWGKKKERIEEEEWRKKRLDTYVSHKGVREDSILPVGPGHGAKGTKTNSAL
jgi:hypothetical protein